MKDVISVALPKGRLGEKVYKLFASAGYVADEILSETRKLIFETEDKRVRFFWVKPTDVTVYVGRGAADIGIAGTDIIKEHGEDDIFELADLDIGKCKMAVAAPKEYRENKEKVLRVATKFPKIATKYYSSLSRDIDIIKLNGSIEIAPLLGLSDVIVDIVETGKTLKENGLEVIADVIKIKAQIIANKASYQFKHGAITEIVDSIERKK